MVFGLADEAALAGPHTGNTKRVSSAGTAFDSGFFFLFALEQCIPFILLLLLVRVFWGRGLCFREQFGVFLFVSLPSESLPLAHHLQRAITLSVAKAGLWMQRSTTLACGEPGPKGFLCLLPPLFIGSD